MSIARTTLLALAGSLALAISLACGGGGDIAVSGSSDGAAEAPAASGPAHGSVAFHSYSSGRMFLTFNSDSKVTYSWKNMPGPAVEGEYTHEGADIAITFPEGIKHMGRIAMTLKQLDECSLAQSSWTDTDGKVNETSTMFERTKPKCR